VLPALAASAALPGCGTHAPVLLGFAPDCVPLLTHLLLLLELLLLLLPLLMLPVVPLSFVVTLAALLLLPLLRLTLAAPCW
jgi:hypothetical protein